MLKTRRLLSRGLKRVNKGIKPKKVPKGLPAWLKAIPEGAHGSGTEQKRLWRLTSDYCRIRDWHTWDGRCIATGKKLDHWNDGQGGHFKSWQKCNGMYKFCTDNIFLQSAYSNSFGDKDDWKAFEKEIARRHGFNRLYGIEDDNKSCPLKITKEMVIDMIETRLKDIGTLESKPPYYERVMKLKELSV